MTSIANPKEGDGVPNGQTNSFALTIGEVKDSWVKLAHGSKKRNMVLVLGAGRVCQPAVELLSSIGSNSPRKWTKACNIAEFEEQNCVQVIVASLYLKDAEEVHSVFTISYLSVLVLRSYRCHCLLNADN